MLSGIKKGKKKQKTPSNSTQSGSTGSSVRAVGSASEPEPSSSLGHKPSASSSSSANASVADQLRDLLKSTSSLEARSVETRNDRQHQEGSSEDTVVVSSVYAKKQDMTIQQMLVEEKTSGYSLIEQETRDLLRSKSKKRKSRNDDDVDQDTVYLGEESTHRTMQRHVSRQVARNDRQDQIASKCWWWIRSPSFDRSRLVAVGEYVSLVVAPSNRSLTPFEHFYLVPVPHVESLTAADNFVWHEVHQFQSSLVDMFSKQSKSLVFLETVLPSKSFWQTKLECIAVPTDAWHEVPLYFKSALAEQAQDHGVHQKLFKIHVKQQPLHRTVPGGGFPYFYVQYDQHSGFAQLIEGNRFPKDFGIDTLTGMLHRDPIRFRKTEASSREQEQAGMRALLEQWKEHDWTRLSDSRESVVGNRV